MADCNLTLEIFLFMRLQYRYPRFAVWLARCWWGAAWLLLAGGLAGAEVPTRVDLAAGSCSLELPPGWSVKPAGTKGAVLQPPRPGLTPVEVAVWPIPAGGEASPTAAAAAQETALFRLVPYARVSEREIQTAAGWPGLLVTGQVKSANGELNDSLFVALADQHHYYVIGVFTPSGEAEKIWAETVASLVHSFKITGPVVRDTRADPEPLAAGPVVPPTTQPRPLPAPPLTPPVATPSLPPPPATGWPEFPGGSPTAASEAPGGDKAAPAAGAVLPPPVTVIKAATPVTADPPPVPAESGPPVVSKPNFTPFTTPRGYTFSLPAGWQVRETQGRLEVSAPHRAGTLPVAGVAVWAVDGIPAEQGAAAVGREVLSRWEPAAGATDWTERSADRLVWLAGLIGTGESQRRLVACCAVEEGQGLVSVLYARGDEFAAQRPILLQVLRNLQGGPWWAGRPEGDEAAGPDEREADRGEAKGDEPRLETAGQWWVDPTLRALQIPFPAGWRVRGGLLMVNGSWTLSLRADSNDQQGLALIWQQPVAPFYRELTPVLSNLGWREGDRYVANAGDEPLRILSRPTPENYLLQHWLGRQEPRLEEVQIERRETAPAASQLASPEGQAEKIWLRGRSPQGQRQAICLVATGRSPLRVGSNCWQAAVIQAQAPAGSLGAVSEVLYQALRGVQVAVRADPTAAAAMRELVEAAHQAATAIEAEVTGKPPAAANLTAPGLTEGQTEQLPRFEPVQPTGPPTQLYLVLEHLRPAGQGRLWIMPPLAVIAWGSAERAVDEGRELPVAELTENYWQQLLK